MPAGIALVSVYASMDPEAVIETSIRACENTGFEVEEPGVQEWTYGKQATLAYEKTRYRVYFGGEDETVEPALRISLGQDIYPSSYATETDYRRQMDVIFELVSRLAVALDSEYVALFNPEGRSTDVLPDERPVGENIERLPRFGIYSESVLDSLGGLDQLFDSEPWYTAHLDGGKTLVIESGDIWALAGWTPPLEADYLVGAQLCTESGEG